MRKSQAKSMEHHEPVAIYLLFRTDAKVVGDLVDLLERLQIEYFLDRKDIGWGAPVTEGISEGLRRCSFVLVVLSPASLKSQWVPFELGQAHALGKTILPFLTHPSLDVPDYLRNLNHKVGLAELEMDLREIFDLPKREIAYWSPEEAQAVIELLVKKGLSDVEIIDNVGRYRLGREWINGRLQEIRGKEGHREQEEL